MPFSASEARPWMLERLKELNPTSLLDIGAGSGTYGKLFAEHFPHAYTIGVEIWQPYLARFDLPKLYDWVIHDDVRAIEMPETDVIILGDVLEHMESHEAEMVWDQARRAARKAVYLSIPIIHYPQEPVYGNPYEEHVVDDYTHASVLCSFPGITSWWTGEIVGCYEALTCVPT